MMFASAIEEALHDRALSVISDLDFHRLTQAIYTAGRWNGEDLKRRPAAWDFQRSSALLARLQRQETLIRDRDFARGVSRVLTVEASASAEEVATLADPFAYISHASAMRLHGLGRPVGAPLHVSRPARQAWARRFMDESFGLPNSEAGDTPVLSRPTFGPTLRRRRLLLRETMETTPTTMLGQVRVTTVGATFVAMLAEPQFCGGMAAVLEVWRQHAVEHLPAIIEAVDEAAAKIVKVRAGHILTEHLGVERPEIAAWTAFAQRGGSRKLDPDRPYAPTFSARWMISLNTAQSEE
jgi:predicted transcriptional regulator of viral defense system